MNQRANDSSIGPFVEDDWFSDACVPELREDETLYSWCARFHRLNGGYESRATSRVLFGHPTAGLWHDIPGHMGNFQLKTRGALGESRELLLKRTLFGFHSPFLPVELEDQLLQQLLTGGSTNVRKQLGLSRYGSPAFNALKFCPDCVRQQIQERGFAWWQTSQQLPTSLICRTHGEWLCRCAERQVRGIFPDFQSLLESRQGIASEHPVLSSADLEQLSRLSNWGVALKEVNGLKFTDETLRHCYQFQAKTHGWFTFLGTVRMQKLRDEFVGKYGGILQLFGSDFFGDLYDANAGFLAHVFRRHPSRRHPLKHILLTNFLFNSAEEFLEVYKKVQSAYQSGGEVAIKNMLCDCQLELIKLVTASGLPVSQAAAKLAYPGGWQSSSWRNAASTIGFCGPTSLALSKRKN